MSVPLLREIWDDLQGTALIEGAIMLPVLFVLFFGVFEFSWYFYNQHRVSTGIRDAARYIARSDNLPSPPTTVPTAVQSAAQNLATTGDTSGVCVNGTESTCRVAGWKSGDVQIQTGSATCTTVCQGGTTTMYDVQVSTSFLPTNLGMLGFLNLSPFSISVAHYERIISGGS